MCADRLDQAVSPYDTMLQQRGVSVLTADLFTHRVIQAEQPDGLALADRLAVVPSPRAASALSRQSWFPAARSSLRVITPGAETARSVGVSAADRARLAAAICEAPDGVVGRREAGRHPVRAGK